MDRSPASVGIYRFVVEGWPLADALREIERHRGLRPQGRGDHFVHPDLPKIAPGITRPGPDVCDVERGVPPDPIDRRGSGRLPPATEGYAGRSRPAANPIRGAEE